MRGQVRAGLAVALLSALTLALAAPAAAAHTTRVGDDAGGAPVEFTPAPTPGIVGGTPASPGQFPYQVAVAVPGVQGIPLRSQFCGGSLISPDTVVTAAHCIVRVVVVEDDPDGSGLLIRRIKYAKPTQVVVYAGSVDLGAGGGAQRIAVRRIRRSPDLVVDPHLAGFDFNLDTFQPDVAVLQLAEPAAPPAVPVALAQPGDEALYPAGTPATVTGWGIVDAIGRQPAVLNDATVPIVADADCTTAYGTDVDMTRHLCAGDLANGGVDACYGDSGGPLVVDDAGQPLQVGIVLGGDGCGAVERPGVYTRVAAVSDFVGRYQDPDEAPGAPRQVTAEQHAERVLVRWRPPDFDGGTSITGYQVKVGDRPAVTVSGSTRSTYVNVARLVSGRRYRLTVRATNDVGTGAAKVRTFTCLAGGPALPCGVVP